MTETNDREFIYINRKIFDSSLWQNNKELICYLKLCFEMNQGNKITITEANLRELFQVNKRQLQTVLSRLKKLKVIIYSKTNTGAYRIENQAIDLVRVDKPPIERDDYG